MKIHPTVDQIDHLGVQGIIRILMQRIMEKGENDQTMGKGENDQTMEKGENDLIMKRGIIMMENEGKEVTMMENDLTMMENEGLITMGRG